MLSIDSIERANSGHPGMPMGMADIAEVLWRDYLVHHPTQPSWINRDRFVLSNGHGAMLLYSLLHLCGYAVSMADLKAFRQLDSITPGHPEYGLTPGVDTTTGPLAQGMATAVGMALAERLLAAQFNRDHHDIINHFTYVFLGDGCLMEGLSHEAASLAGTLKLSKLIACYDSNGISIDGPVDPWFNDNTALRFEAYGWQVIDDVNGHDRQQIKQAIADARHHSAQPTLIIFKTTIGFGSPKHAGSAASHGAPLGMEEIAAVRNALSWHHPPFEIPPSIYEAWDATASGEARYQQWCQKLQFYRQAFPECHDELMRRYRGDMPQTLHANYQQLLQQALDCQQAQATRVSSATCLEHWVPTLGELFGGSADLSPSNNTHSTHSHAISADDFSGNYLHYGVREFAMASLMNGMALHGGLLPYGGTFLVFADYARNAIRLSAMMNLKVIYVLTHDSIGLGEDGPTHQPIEHLTMLRSTPNLTVWRPADAFETTVAWHSCLTQPGAKVLVLSRQKLRQLEHSLEQQTEIAQGGYIYSDATHTPDLILISCGSETQLAIAAAASLLSQGVNVRVVSMPCMEIFLNQAQAYREQVLPQGIPRIAIEAGRPESWYRWTTEVLGLESFGRSAPGERIYEAMGLTEAAIVAHSKQVLAALANTV